MKLNLIINILFLQNELPYFWRTPEVVGLASNVKTVGNVGYNDTREETVFTLLKEVSDLYLQ